MTGGGGQARLTGQRDRPVLFYGVVGSQTERVVGFFLERAAADGMEWNRAVASVD
jgi:hypothetical protein